MKYFGRVWDPAYYRTYLEAGAEPLGYRSVQAEVSRALASPADFHDVPKQAGDYFRKTSGLFRDSDEDRRPAWVVCDRRYVSARWPGDVHAFAAAFARRPGGIPRFFNNAIDGRTKMNQTAIFAPFLTTMLLTLIVWFYMYSKRIPLIQKSKIDPNALTAAELARISPPSVSNPSDNLKNLFELPTLFYGLMLYLFVTGKVDEAYLIAAWVFAGFSRAAQRGALHGQHRHAAILALLHLRIGAVVHGGARCLECALAERS